MHSFNRVHGAGACHVMYVPRPMSTCTCTIEYQIAVQHGLSTSDCLAIYIATDMASHRVYKIYGQIKSLEKGWNFAMNGCRMLEAIMSTRRDELQA